MTKRRVALRLSRRLLERDQLYRTVDGLRFSIDPEDPFQALMVTSLYDRELTRAAAAQARPGSVVIDGGAQLGYLTLRFARAVGPQGAVHAFEPDPRVAPRLRVHVQANELTWVTVEECGLLDEARNIALALPATFGWASVVPGAVDAAQTTTVPTTTLDRFVDEREVDPARISLIKLDLEGAELEALHGARDTLARTRGAVLVEYLPERMRARDQDPEELLGILRSSGYGEPTSVTAEDLLFRKP